MTDQPGNDRELVKEHPRPRQVSFWLGGSGEDPTDLRQFTIGPAPHFRSKEWRRAFMAELKPALDGALGALEMEFDEPGDLLRLLPLLETLLTDGIDLIYEMVVSYHPDLDREKVWIGQNASDEQLVVALSKILEMADPFGLKRRLAGIGGPARIGTSGNSPPPNGDSIGETPTT